MIKVYCDRCGKEVGELEVYTLLVQGPTIKAWDDNYMYGRKDYQICRDCIEDVDKLIATKQTDCAWK